MPHRPSDHAEDLCGSADRSESVQAEKFRNRRLAGRRDRLRSQAREREETTELRREDAAHQAELTHPQRDHRPVRIAQNLEELQVVPNRTCAIRNFKNIRETVRAQGQHTPGEVGRPPQKIVSRKNEPAALFGGRLAPQQMREPSLQTGLGGRGELDIQVPWGHRSFAAGCAQSFIERQAIFLAPRVPAALFRRAASHDARQRRFTHQASDFPFLPIRIGFDRLRIEKLVHPKLDNVRARQLGVLGL